MFWAAQKVANTTLSRHAVATRGCHGNLQRTQKKRHFIRPRKRARHFRWPKEVEAKAQAKAFHDEEKEKVSEVWKCRAARPAS